MCIRDRAHVLSEVATVTIFEKSRHTGGRLATLNVDTYSFDFGTQFFKCKDKRFYQFLTTLIQQGVIQPWHARFIEISQEQRSEVRQWDDSYPHYVGVPHMNQISQILARDLNILHNVKITEIIQQDTWTLIDDTGIHYDAFDWVISTCPAAQTAQILPHSFSHYNALQSVNMQACFSLMLGFKQQQDLGFDAALVKGKDISWISVNSAKPNRPDSLCLLVHATNKWADANFEQEQALTKKHLIAETQSILDIDLNKADFTALHAWRYANMKKRPQLNLVDHHHQLAACGDWCHQGRVESAFISAYATAKAIIEGINYA